MGLRAILVAALIAMCVQALPARADADRVLIFAAASLKGPMDDAAAAYTKATATPVTVSYAGSQTLAKQIESGAECDLIVTADSAWMDYLQERTLIVGDTRRNLLGNSLVMIAPEANPVTIDLSAAPDLVALLGDGRLAIGDPEAVPAGRYAKAALSALNLWDGVATHLLPAENVRLVLAYVARGEAPLGIVYKTDALAEPHVAVAAEFPARSHPAIIYPAAVTVAADPRAAALLDFLDTEAGFTAFQKAGFVRPPPSS